MAARNDITGSVRLTDVESVSIRDTAVAEIVMRGGRADDVHFARVSVTERIDFRGGRFTGSAHFDQVESLGEVTLNGSESTGALHFEGCVLRADFSFAGARLSAPLLLRGCAFEAELSFAGTEAHDDVMIERSVITGEASFDGGHYGDDLLIRTVEARSDFRFGRVRVDGSFLFEDSTFHRDLRLDEGHYAGAVLLRRISVAGRAEFDRSEALGAWAFQEVTFAGAVSFEEGTYRDNTLFEGVRFEDEVTFESALFESEVLFRDVVFLGPVSFRGAKFRGGLRFEHVTFGGSVDFDVEVSALDLVNVTFASQTSMVVDGAEIAVEECKFAAPVAVDSRTACRVRSLTGTDATNLVLVNVDLSACRLGGVYNLDELRAEAATFARAPAGWRLSWRWPWLVKRSARLVVVEEVFLRSRLGPPALAGDWVPLMGPDVPDHDEKILPGDVARTYRQLRKSREDTKDEPGAADFYYGEMEMRRLAAPRGGAERLVLWLYWLTSGYGLRGLRALACLLALVLVCATLMGRFGFADPHSWVDSLVYVADSATRLVGSGTAERLTGWGVTLQIVVRLLGPVLLGLAILSVRGRTKR